jgi:hypothetical protein
MGTIPPVIGFGGTGGLGASAFRHEADNQAEAAAAVESLKKSRRCRLISLLPSSSSSAMMIHQTLESRLESRERVPAAIGDVPKGDFRYDILQEIGHDRVRLHRIDR